MIEQNPSSDDKAALIAELGRLVVRFQDANQQHDEAVGEVYGLGPAERLCLSALWLGPQTASAIARHTRLTPAATTALVDRLEKRGFVRRKPDPSDRRKVWIEAAEATFALAQDAYMPLQQAGEASLGTHTAAELKTFEKILRNSLTIQEAETQAFLGRHGKS